MKRALRIIVPVLLILAVLASMAWYFLIYDREFTKDMILWSARTLEENGRREAAAWMYDLAYSQSSQEDAVAIELSEQYRAYGNYTKAEFTLTEAISKNPTAALYMALSKLYVEQDKLLDAVNMLNHIDDPQIRGELEAQRPATPTVSYEPGFYSQYISIDVLSESGTLYVSADGQYPSVSQDLYTAPVKLGIGETALYCLCVGDNGLVSPLGLYGYTVGGVVEPVSFTDDAIETAIRQLLNTGENTTLYTSDLWTITEFTLPAEAQTFTDLAFLTRLERLTMDSAPAGVLTQAGTISTLKQLSMPNCQLNADDLDVLATLTSLESLDLSGCGLSSIAALEPLKNVSVLDLSSNTVRNLSSLSSMTGLKQLDLSHNAVTDLAALSTLLNLTVLDVSYNSLTSLNPISRLTALTELNAANNQISNIDTLKSLTALTALDISHNAVADVGSLALCTAITDLSIANNTITDISTLSTLVQLQSFDMSYNQITALPIFHADCGLVTLNASYNLLTNLDSLAGLDSLNTVNVDYNAEIESLEPLDSCHVLIQVNAYGTLVTEVDFLTDKSIVVNYDPTL